MQNYDQRNLNDHELDVQESDEYDGSSYCLTRKWLRQVLKKLDQLVEHDPEVVRDRGSLNY